MKSEFKCKECGKIVKLSKHDFKLRQANPGKYVDICSECLAKPPKVGEKTIKKEKVEYKGKLNEKSNGEIELQ